MIADAEQELECACMTTQQKITAIQAIITNHHDNVAAMSAANVGQGLEDLVIEAMNTALKEDLAVIFAANSSQPAAQNVRRKRQRDARAVCSQRETKVAGQSCRCAAGPRRSLFSGASLTA